jgi:hypothetical protein
MVTSSGSEYTRKYDCDYREYEIDFDTKKPQHEGSLCQNGSKESQQQAENEKRYF